MTGSPYDKVPQFQNVRLFRVVEPVGHCECCGIHGQYLQPIGDIERLTREQILDQLERLGSTSERHLLVTGIFEIITLTEEISRKAEVRPG